jgi:transposase, IS30 family
MAGFTESMINERVQVFWAALQRGEFITDAAAEAGTYRKKGARWMAAAGGVRPRRGRDLQGRYLSFAEREEIALSSARGESMRCIARRLGRSPATISRELRRNADRDGGYRATTAHALAYGRAGRPKPAKLATNARLRAKVQEYLQQHYSPEQITGRLRVEFPDDPEMRVSPETIYQARRVLPHRCAARSYSSKGRPSGPPTDGPAVARVPANTRPHSSDRGFAETRTRPLPR